MSAWMARSTAGIIDFHAGSTSLRLWFCPRQCTGKCTKHCPTSGNEENDCSILLPEFLTCRIPNLISLVETLSSASRSSPYYRPRKSHYSQIEHAEPD